MTDDDIFAVHQYLFSNTKNPVQMRAELARGLAPWGTPADVVLYIPLYSTGMGPSTINPRITWLQSQGWNWAKLAAANQAQLNAIAASPIAPRVPFGMRKRLTELQSRAEEIRRTGVGPLGALLTPSPSWSTSQLLTALHYLNHGIAGIKLAAALHILMELGWVVVKPDRHICRFLSRLGGPWQHYFAKPGATTLHAYGLVPFLNDWRDACAAIAASAKHPPLRGLTSRQIDALIMWYTQNVTKAARGWRPTPICRATPACPACAVSGCSSRPSQADAGGQCANPARPTLTSCRA